MNKENNLQSKLPINIDALLGGKVVEWERLDFKKGWNPEDVMHTACAFANDMHNLGGGYIIVGIEERNGVPVLPPCGVDFHTMDDIQKDLVRLAHLIQPTVNILTFPVEYIGKMILVVQVPGGEVRPYKAPLKLSKDAEKLGKVYYVRQGSVTRKANEEEERTLMSLCNKVPFDDRINQQYTIDVLSRGYIADYLRQVGSKMTHEEVMQMPMEELGWKLQIIGGTPEQLYPKNIGLLMFTEEPHKYIPYARIEIVHFHDDIGDRFEEQILSGPMYVQLQKALNYLKSICIEKVMKVRGEAEAVRVWNYPYDALEEMVANSVFHKSYDEREPIEIRINKTSIEVLSFAGPMPPLTNADLRKPRIISRHYRNRRIGAFLKELHMTEGRSTGFPKIYGAVKRNDSPMPTFETDDHNSYFLATIPIHQAFVDDVAYLRSIGKDYMDKNVPQDVPQNVPQEILLQLTERQLLILNMIMTNHRITREEMSLKIHKSLKTVARELDEIRKYINITFEGTPSDGSWRVTVKTK